MSMPLPKPRHTVERSDNLVRVILPSKKNIVHLLWFGLWFFFWAYMLYGFVYIATAVNKAVEIGNNSIPPVQPGGAFIWVSICLSVFFLALLALGAFGIDRLAWLLTGKDVIEATSDVLRVSRQTFVRKSFKEYSAGEIKDLRFVRQARFAPFRSVRRLLSSNGMIAFDYAAKTFRFGSELEEVEAKQIILTIQEGLHHQKAG